MVQKVKEYAVYKGEDFIAVGTKLELAKELNVKPETIKFYTTPSYQRRLEKRKAHRRGRITVVELEDEEDGQ